MQRGLRSNPAALAAKRPVNLRTPARAGSSEAKRSSSVPKNSPGQNGVSALRSGVAGKTHSGAARDRLTVLSVERIANSVKKTGRNARTSAAANRVDVRVKTGVSPTVWSAMASGTLERSSNVSGPRIRLTGSKKPTNKAVAARTEIAIVTVRSENAIATVRTGTVIVTVQTETAIVRTGTGRAAA